MTDLLGLGLKYGTLLVDVITTAVRATSSDMSDADIKAEIERIKAREREDIAADLDTVKS